MSKEAPNHILDLSSMAFEYQFLVSFFARDITTNHIRPIDYNFTDWSANLLIAQIVRPACLN